MAEIPDNVMLVDPKTMPQLGPVQLVDRHPDDQVTAPAEADETALALGEPVAAVIHALGLQELPVICYRARYGCRLDSGELARRVSLTLMYQGRHVWLECIHYPAGHLMLANTAWARAMLGLGDMPERDYFEKEEIPF
ncbi:MAG: hypothetical protein WD151_15175 [Phycisphaeraceae bacterium]